MVSKMRKAFTLVELIFVIIIVSLLSTATYKALQMIVTRSYKAKQTTKLSLESQTTLNQISSYLKYRIPYSTIGYDPESGDYEYIGSLTSNKPVLEWYGQAIEAFEKGYFSEFIDMDQTDKANQTVLSPDTDGDNIASLEKKKWNTNDDIYANKIVNLIFAGSFDRGNGSSNSYANTFGWHGGNSNDSFDIDIDSSGIITFDDTPTFVYEKYFLVDSAYAIARGADIDTTASCIQNLDIKSNDLANTLFLFSNYRPWKGETFCADKQGGSKVGDVDILMQHIQGFRFEQIDYTIRIALDINKTIKGSSPVHFSKMKVVF